MVRVDRLRPAPTPTVIAPSNAMVPGLVFSQRMATRAVRTRNASVDNVSRAFVAIPHALMRVWPAI